MSFAGEPSAAPLAATLTKPAWLTDFSLGVKESWDDNVFLSGATADHFQHPLPYYFALAPQGSVVALRNESSWVTTVSPKLGINFAPLLGNQTLLQTLSLAYAPDFVIYHDQSSESYNAHRFAAAIKGRAKALTFSADDGFIYIDGNDNGAFYPDGDVSAFATAVALRERREQIQDRANVTLQYDGDNYFLRPTASLLLYDLMTTITNVTGYQNYADRYDVNGGLDAGYRLQPQFAVTLGYRYGHQGQEQFSFNTASSPSDYQRVLLGLEGNPWRWLDVKLLGGPDFRNYPADNASHVSPVNDLHLVTYYGEASVIATVTARDTLTFKYKQWQWVSACGLLPYFDSLYDLSYHRKLTDRLGFDCEGRLMEDNFSVANYPVKSQRDDRQYTLSASLNYAFNSHVAATLGYARDWGRNVQDGVANYSTREFDRNVVSLGLQAKF